jgi:hypothetical protein
MLEGLRDSIKMRYPANHFDEVGGLLDNSLLGSPVTGRLQLHATGHCAVTGSLGRASGSTPRAGSSAAKIAARASRSFELMDKYFIVERQELARTRSADCSRLATCSHDGA